MGVPETTGRANKVCVTCAQQPQEINPHHPKRSHSEALKVPRDTICWLTRRTRWLAVIGSDKGFVLFLSDCVACYTGSFVTPQLVVSNSQSKERLQEVAECTGLVAVWFRSVSFHCW